MFEVLYMSDRRTCGLTWHIEVASPVSGGCTSTEEAGDKDIGTAVLLYVYMMLPLTKAQNCWEVEVTGRVHANSTAG